MEFIINNYLDFDGIWCLHVVSVHDMTAESGDDGGGDAYCGPDDFASGYSVCQFPAPAS